MISTRVLFSLLYIHWVADFVMQSRWIAENKAHKIRALLLHTITYGMWFYPMGNWNWQFATLNMLLHGAVDTITSRVTSYLWHNGKRYEFFVVIGFDQLIHFIIMVELWLWLGR